MTERESAIISQVRGSLSSRHLPLKVLEEWSSTEDEWLYITVSPTKEGLRASDYADAMAEIEKELRIAGIENVLLVPTVPE